MKLNRWFVVGILVFLVVLFIVELQLPKNFSWKPTFHHADKQPFGCYLFDSLLTKTMPQGYTVTDSSLFLLAKDSTMKRGILVVADELSLIPAELNAVFSMANNGSHVMLVAHDLGMFAKDTLGLRIWGSNGTFDLQNFVKYNKERDTLRWVSDTLGYKPQKYAVFSPLLTHRFGFEVDTAHAKTIRTPLDKQALNEEGYALAATIQQGEGYITYVCVPLLFTNYAVVDQDDDHHNTIGFTLRCLSLMKDLPVVRTEVYCPKYDETEQTPLRYIISHPPLRWALYTLLAGALLFLIFEGRRRQRVIPIEKAPENHSLEFIHLVGSLYYHSRERRSLVVRKYIYFAEELRRTVHVDVTDASEDDITLPTLARLTTMDEKEIRDLILRLRLLADTTDEDTEISRKQMKQYIDQMNWIIKNI